MAGGLKRGSITQQSIMSENLEYQSPLRKEHASWPDQPSAVRTIAAVFTGPAVIRKIIVRRNAPVKTRSNPTVIPQQHHASILHR
jgi:hypothetical protein